MRVTQSMLSNNMLRNLNNSNSKMGKLQEQLSSGSRLTRPSDDPVATVKGIGYRTTLGKNDQFTRNTNEINSWLDSSDDALGQVGSALQRVKELVTQAANDTETDADRDKVKAEIDQIRQQLRDVANTQVGDNYIFSGTKTSEPLFSNPEANSSASDKNVPMNGNSENVTVELFSEVSLNTNVDGKKLFSNIDNLMADVQTALNDTDVLNEGNTSGSAISNLLGQISSKTEDTLQVRSTVGAKQNRVDMMTDRLSTQKISVTKQMSNNEDVDYEGTITDLITEESIQRAALSVGGRIIQPTLVDFLR